MNFSFSAFGRVKLGAKWRISYQSLLDGKLYYILGGSGAIKTAAEKIDLLPGRLYLIPALLEAEYISNPKDPIDHLFFNFTLNPPLRLENAAEIMPTHEMKLLAEFTAEALSDKNRPKEQLLRIAENSFDSLWIYINDLIKPDFQNDSRVIDALDFIRKNFSKPVSVSDMAEAVHLECCHFIKLFSRQVGITPYRYLKNYRIDTAIKQIKNGEKVSAAAYNCGFETPSAFSAAVKKQFGMTPRELAEKR